jgi:hypothetical protein
MSQLTNVVFISYDTSILSLSCQSPPKKRRAFFLYRSTILVHNRIDVHKNSYQIKIFVS